jgi:hypothetical protein
MAGSMVIREPKKLALFPDNQDDTWAQTYDGVMMIQQIANYGLQEGAGGQKQTFGPGRPKNFKPDTVINGQHRPTFTTRPLTICG